MPHTPLNISVSMADSMTEPHAVRDAVVQEIEDLKKPLPPPIESLALFVQNRFTEAKNFKEERGINAQIADCRRRFDGEYSPSKLQDIRDLGGSAVYFNMSGSKVLSGFAWLLEIFGEEESQGFDLKATPIPDMKDGQQEDLRKEAVERTLAVLGDADLVDIEEETGKMYDTLLRDSQEQADERAKRMGDKIADQMAEGRFSSEFARFLLDYFTYPLAILKGLEVASERSLVWRGDKAVVDVVSRPLFERVPPSDLYPAPNSKRLDDGYVCETMMWARADLADKRGVEGWDVKNIDAVMSQPSHPEHIVDNSDRAEDDDRDVSINAGMPTESLQVVRFVGRVPGHLVKAWRVSGIKSVDEKRYYSLIVDRVGDFVVRVIKNPDPLGKPPYWADSFTSRADSLWGKGVLQVIAHLQDGINACMRNALDNMAFSAAPQMVVDRAQLVGNLDIRSVVARKIWEINSSKARGSTHRAIDFFNIPNNASDLLAMAEYLQAEADNLTYPRVEQGLSSPGDTTATEASIVSGSASRNIRRSADSIDKKVIIPCIEHMFRYNMVTLSGPGSELLKGDMRVVPGGMIARISKAELQRRHVEFLNTTANDLDSRIVGPRQRAVALRSAAEASGLDAEKVVPDPETLPETFSAPEEAPQ